MKINMKKIGLALLLTTFMAPMFSEACTVIVVGKNASKDGSVIISQTDNGDDSRIRIFPAMTYKPGEKAPVYWGIQNVDRPLDDLGEIIGYIPQVEKTYKFFLSAYSHINEHQLAMAESTTSMREEMKFEREDGDQIMTIEQAQIFALQRFTKAREAVEFIGQLMSEYGFLPSCIGESESLVVADPNEAWVFEVKAVGAWKKDSGKPGAVWVAQRVPDDHAVMIPNWSVIKEVNIDDKDNFLASSNYVDFAIEKGWFDPNGTIPFNWQDVYCPTPREWGTSRFWKFHREVAPNYRDWPERDLTSPFQGLEDYYQYVEPLSIYPFSIKPEEKLDIHYVMDFQRSFFEGTMYDMTEDPDWYVPGEDGTMYKSPIATPFPTKEMRRLLDINYRRNVARGGYGYVAQLRSWLPDEIGGVYWVYQDNETTGMYFPLYVGINEVNTKLKTFDPTQYNEESAKWVIDFVDNLLYLRWQDAFAYLLEKRNPVEKGIFDEQKDIDAKAQELYKKSPEKAKKYLTEYCWETTDEIVDFYRQMRNELLTKYTNNKQGINFQ